MAKKFYLTNKDFYDEYIVSYNQGKPTNKLIKMFELIATNYSSKFNNLCELDKNSCINYAVSEAYLKWKTFDIEKPESIFSFFTQVIKNDLTISYKNIMRNSHLNISIDYLFTKDER
jgi:hypothetical protein